MHATNTLEAQPLSSGGLRIVLLARSAVTRKAMRDGLQQSGLYVSFEADPAKLELRELREADPQAVVIALDAAVEHALSNFDDVLFDPKVSVIYEDAEAVLARDAWESARWSRHLAAKLLGHDDVLPPAPAVSVKAAPTAAVVVKFDAPLDFPSAVTPAKTLVPAAPEAASTLAAAYDPPLIKAFVADEVVSNVTGLEVTEAKAQPVSMAALFDPVAAMASEAEPKHLSAPRLWGDALALVPLESQPVSEVSPEQDQALLISTRVRPAPDVIDDAATAISPDASDAPVKFVLVRAGIGGPDALRQLLASVPTDSRDIFLIRQHLYGGRYEHLIRQLARVASVPVSLAQPGNMPVAGRAYLLADSVALESSPTGLKFVRGGAEDFSAVPATGNAVVLLSGCGLSVLQAATRWSQGAAALVAQAPDTCFDAEASLAVQAQGGILAAPAELVSALTLKE